MKKMFVVAVLAALGCGSSAQIISAPASVPVVSAQAGSDYIGQALPAYYLDPTHQKVEMSYLAGDGLTADLIDLPIMDTDGDIVSFRYRYNFSRGVREVYSDYEPVPYLSAGVGFGTWGLIIGLTTTLLPATSGLPCPSEKTQL